MPPKCLSRVIKAAGESIITGIQSDIDRFNCQTTTIKCLSAAEGGGGVVRFRVEEDKAF